jgi:histidine triad (HIT) family protein
MENCLFCKILNKQLKAEFVYEDDDIACIKDVNPQAPTHLLILPKKHIATILDLTEEDEKLIGKMVLKAGEIAKRFNISNNGFRLIFNTNKDAGQSVFHIHLHLVGGRKLKWPPG